MDPKMDPKMDPQNDPKMDPQNDPKMEVIFWPLSEVIFRYNLWGVFRPSGGSNTTAQQPHLRPRNGPIPGYLQIGDPTGDAGLRPAGDM